MNQSTSLAKISAAIVAASAEMENAVKNAENPFIGNRYANLEALLAVAKPVLKKHDLAILQFPAKADNGGVALVTRLIHSSGEYIEEIAGSPIERANPQGVGSAITYLRRYALAAVCGITQEDDDGCAAVAPPERKAATTTAPRTQATKPAPPSQPAKAPAAGEQSRDIVVTEAKELKSGQSAKGKWTMWKIIGEDDEGNALDFTTFSPELYDAAQAAVSTGVPVPAIWLEKQNGRFVNRELTSLAGKVPF